LAIVCRDHAACAGLMPPPLSCRATFPGPSPSFAARKMRCTIGTAPPALSGAQDAETEYFRADVRSRKRHRRPDLLDPPTSPLPGEEAPPKRVAAAILSMALSHS
jgi:hypothetical protein